MGSRFIITEEEKKNILRQYGVISEQKVPLMTILAVPSKVGVSSQDNSNIVYLTQRDEKGQEIPNSKYSYKVKGVYDPGALLPNVNFDVKLRSVRRNAAGDLLGEAQPTNTFMQKTMNTLVNKKYRTTDNWLVFTVPVAKLNSSLQTLSQNKGSSATIDAGNGVDINLSLVS